MLELYDRKELWQKAWAKVIKARGIRPGDLLCDNSGSYKAKEYLGQDLRKAWDKRTGDDNFVCEK